MINKDETDISINQISTLNVVKIILTLPFFLIGTTNVHSFIDTGDEKSTASNLFGVIANGPVIRLLY